MRTSRSVRLPVLLWVLVGLAACRQPPSAPAPSPPPAAPAPAAPPPPARDLAGGPGVVPGPLDRPPHPAMATAAHGLAVLNAAAAAAGAPERGSGTVDSAFARLGSMAPGSTQEARAEFAWCYRTGSSDADRAEAAAGLALALVLEQDPQGLQARLTDAYGVQLLVAGMSGGSARVAAARGVVMAAAGRDRDARAAASRLGEAQKLEGWAAWGAGEIWALLSEHGRALELYERALADPAAPARFFQSRARVRARLGEAVGALADSGKAIDKQARCLECRLTEAEALWLTGEAKHRAEALANLQELSAKATGPHAMSARVLLSLIHLDGSGDAAAVGQVTPLLEQMGRTPDATAEAGLVRGLMDHRQGRHADAVKALSAAVQRLPPGLWRSRGQWALAEAAVQARQPDQALAALRLLEAEDGPSAAAAALSAQAMDLQGKAAAAADERLRAYVLDPYSAERAKAAGLGARAGGAERAAASQRIWRLIGRAAPRLALVAATALAEKDKDSPPLAFAQLAAQRALDEQLPAGTEPPDAAVTFATAAVSRLGGMAPHKAFHLGARRVLVGVLDEGPRPASQDALSVFLKDPDPGVATAAREAHGRGAPRPRTVGH